jgi:hypothetical protein
MTETEQHRRRGSIFGLLGAFTAVALVAGCSVLGPGTPPGFDSEGVSISQVTCGDFATFGDQYRESGDPDLADPLTTYTADGATTWDSAADYFAAACEGVPADTHLDALNARLSDVTCGDYRALDADLQAEWISTWSEEYEVEFDGRSVASVVAIFEGQCATAGGDEPLWNVGLRVGDQLALLLTHEWVDSDGYRYRFEWAAAIVDATSDVTDALPGQADVTVEWRVSGQVTNLTSGRNAPYPVINLVPIWEPDSAACLGIQDWASQAAFASNEPGISGTWCTIFPAPISFATGLELSQPIPDGETVEASFEGEMTFSVLEADLARSLAALKTPTMWAMGLRSTDESLACLLANGVWLVAATGDTGCPRWQS